MFLIFKKGVYQMIDTITLLLNIRDPKNPIRFDSERAYEWGPHIKHIIAGGRSKMHGKTCICHYRPQLKEEEQSGEYFPKVKLLEVIMPGGVQQLLHITFSAPKLIFGNNFNELENYHLEPVCERLSQRLRDMGIFVSPKTLQTADVSQIHYSKNFLLLGQPIEKVFGILRKARPPRRKSYRYEKYSSYTGGGQSVYTYTKRHGLCFYDKKAESRKSKGIPNELYADAWQLPKTIDVLRMESRCGSPADIRKTLTWVGLPVPKPLTLEVLFDFSISQAVLLKEFETFRSYLPPLKYTGNLSDIIKSIKTHNPTLTLLKVVNASLLVKLANELGNKEDVRTLLGVSSAATWSRREKLLSRLKVLPSQKGKILDEIEHQLRDFMSVYFGEKMPF